MSEFYNSASRSRLTISNTYTNRTWADLSKIPVETLNVSLPLGCLWMKLITVCRARCFGNAPLGSYGQPGRIQDVEPASGSVDLCSSNELPATLSRTIHSVSQWRPPIAFYLPTTPSSNSIANRVSDSVDAIGRSDPLSSQATKTIRLRCFQYGSGHCRTTRQVDAST